MQKKLGALLFVLLALSLSGCGMFSSSASTSAAATPATTEDENAAELIAERQKGVREQYKDAQEATATAKADRDKKKVEVEAVEKELETWEKKVKDATDDGVRENAETHVTMLKSDLDLRQAELKEIEEKLAAATTRENLVFGEIFNLSGRGMTHDAMSLVLKDGVSEAVSGGLQNLVTATTEGNANLVTSINGVATKVGDVAKSVDGVATKVGLLETPLKEISKNTKDLVDEAKKLNSRIDTFFLNLEALDGMNKKTAEALAKNLTELSKKQAVHAADPAMLERIAIALEELSTKLNAPAPAPAAPAAPAVSAAPVQQYYQQPQCQQWGSCQMQNGWGVRRVR